MISLFYLFVLALFLKSCSLHKSSLTTVESSKNLQSKKSDVHHHRIYATNNLEIPLELCLNDEKLIDSGEDYVVSYKLVGNTLEGLDNIFFDELPLEVKKIIQLTTGEKYIYSKFQFSVILSHDPAQPNRSVKEYIYTPLIFNKKINCDTLALDSWSFKRQNKKLKLEFADIQ